VPLLPIDLQTLFTQANQVGREQAVQKDALPQAQSLQGSQMAQKTEQRDNAVNETADQQEGTEQVKDRKRRGAERRRGKGAKKDGPAEQPAQKSVVSDPALGRNVDISS
jgi:hypothetical protein